MHRQPRDHTVMKTLPCGRSATAAPRPIDVEADELGDRGPELCSGDGRLTAVDHLLKRVSNAPQFQHVKYFHLCGAPATDSTYRKDRRTSCIAP